MKMRVREDHAIPISKTRWITYATAGAASMFAGSQSAEAAIHYSGLLNVTIPGDGNHRVKLQLDQPGDSIVFEHRETMFGIADKWAGFRAFARAGASFRGPVSIDYHYVEKLQAGEFVSDGHFTRVPPDQLSGFGLLAGVFSGYFVDRGIGFVGFAFNGGAGVQYGWARVRMSGYERGNGLEILDYAYADPGEAIQTGQRSSEGQGSPALGSLGYLAAGAAGLLVWRRRRPKSAD